MQYDPFLYGMLADNEEVLWSGKPDLKCFVLESIFNPLLPFAIVWALFDALFIILLLHEGKQTPWMALPLVGFFALHLMPVWIYIGGVLFSYLRHKHTSFIVTDKGVYVSGGIFTQTYKHQPYEQIASVTIKRGVFDKFLGVGDVELVLLPTGTDFPYPRRSMRKSMTICDIPDFQSVYKLVQELQQKHTAKTRVQ